MTDKVENKEVAQAPAAEQAQAPQQESFDLTINDLNAIRSIIDLASQRGTFKANEMAAVGTIYNKLDGFLTQVSKQGQPQNG